MQKLIDFYNKLSKSEKTRYSRERKIKLNLSVIYIEDMNK